MVSHHPTIQTTCSSSWILLARILSITLSTLLALGAIARAVLVIIYVVTREGENIEALQALIRLTATP